MSIKARLNTFDLTMIVVSVVIGTGIFRTPVEIAQKAQVPTIFFLAWIAGAVISFFGALTLAEVGSRYPAAGGFYKIFSHCYHPAFAFMVNWISVIANAGSSASVAIMGAEYINPLLFPNLAPEAGIRITTIASVILLYGINLGGIKMGARTLNVLMVIKIAVLVLMISAMFIRPSHHDAAVAQALTGNDALKAFWLCFVPIFFTYGGYHQTMNFGSDVPNANRTMPRSIFFGMGLVLVLYLLVSISYVNVLGFEGLKHSPALAAEITAVIVGDYAAVFVSIIMFLAVLAYVNASLLSNPRVYYAMAEENVLPAVFKKVNERTQTQEIALTVYVAIIILFLFTLSSFQKILNYVMFFDSIGLIAACAAVFVLRRRARRANVHDVGIYKMKFYPWLTLIFIVGYALVNASVMYFEPGTAFVGFLLFMAGYPLYYILQKVFKKPAVA
ncbi:basic amino acid/polyamine antiporter, APA family [Chryseolinea serpens]|uniref:Basic amino acid/polyamine antiporter, APA family n=1 Tax=Chryseolinea serpens TaxID=947013 RepID=A0A1M5XU59_9BACT|nr:amino acid permease [Chryseolinea serpens]SHI03068.1 basic amino acid/polyamine antiporter, APA family [Chryseolinea serpens]